MATVAVAYGVASVLKTFHRVGDADVDVAISAFVGGDEVVLALPVDHVRVSAAIHHRAVREVLLGNGAIHRVSAGLRRIDGCEVICIPVHAEVIGTAVRVSGRCRGTLGKVAIFKRLSTGNPLLDRGCIGTLLNGDILRAFHTGVGHAAELFGYLGRQRGINRNRVGCHSVVDATQVSGRLRECSTGLDLGERLEVRCGDVLGHTVDGPTDTVVVGGGIVSSGERTGVELRGVVGHLDAASYLIVVRSIVPLDQIVRSEHQNLTGIGRICG